MEFTDRVLILRVGKFRETDLWVRFLSPRKGVLSAFAFGGSRSRRRFSGCLDVFNDVVFSIKTTRGGLYSALQEGTLMRAPRRLRTDWHRLGIAVNCAKFVEAFGVAPDAAEPAHGLLNEVLLLLEEETPPPANLPVLFRARLAFGQGYSVELASCAKCGKGLSGTSGSAFIVREGFFFCPDCASFHARERGGFMLSVSNETLDALRHVQEYSPSFWREGRLASLSPLGQRECARVIDAFIEHHVGLHWDASRFVRI